MQLVIDKLNQILSHIKNNDTSRYMDIKECSEYCGVSRSTLHRNVKENKLKASNTTGKLLFKVSDVNAWLEN